LTAPDQLTAPAADRPAIPSPGPVRSRDAALTALLLAVLVAWTLYPVWPVMNDHILGDPDTDAIRGMWGFAHLRSSLLPPNTPLWSWQVNAPHGVLALVLPWTTGILMAPLGALFGPLAGYNLSVAMMLWGGAMGTAWLVRATSGSWAAGAAVGACMISQPMLLHAIGDGTPEHVAIWGIPAFLASAVEAIRRKSPAWGLTAGLMAIAVAFDSPYHAVYTLVLGGVVLPLVLISRWEKGRGADLGLTLAAMGGATLVGAGFMAVLFRNFPMEEQVGLDAAALLNMNATDLYTWWQFDFGPEAERDASLAPTLIPTIALWLGLVLALIGAPRSLPWLFAGSLTLCLSFGYNKLLPAELAQWFGNTGGMIGQGILWINHHLYELPGLDSLRFPRRWLVPSAMAFAVSGGFGLARVFGWMRRFKIDRFGIPTVALVLAATGTAMGVDASRIRGNFPMQSLPDVTFTSWLNDQPGSGAVVTVPQLRPAPTTGKRGDIPVFASIAQSLSSADVLYLQVLHGKPIISYPNLKTLQPMRFDADLYRLMRNWDDLAHPSATGNPIPRSAYDSDSEDRRQATIQRLRLAGLRYVVVDRAEYDADGLGYLDAQLQVHTKEVHEFEDGTGVRIYELLPE
jgi:hypothetical protein